MPGSPHRGSLLWLACVLAFIAGSAGLAFEGDPTGLQSRRKTTFDYFGTVCFVAVYDDFRTSAAAERFESTWEEIDGLLARLDASVGVGRAGSDVRRFNDAHGGESIRISPLTADLLKAAMRMYAFTGGAFNPAVANLVDLWGFSPRFRNADPRKLPYDRPRNADGSLPLPDRRYVEAFRRLSDFSAVKLHGDAQTGYVLTKAAPDVTVDGVAYSLKIDLGGIAKGYGAEKAGAILRAHGYEYGYVNLGLSSLSLLKRNVSDKGAPLGHLWAVSVATPDDKAKEFMSIFAQDTGVSTSGTYDVHYSLGGRDYSHLIDPWTGEPTRSEVLSVTVLGADAGDADALSTALCVMGRDKARAFMNASLKEYRVAMVIRGRGGHLELITNIPAGGYALSP